MNRIVRCNKTTVIPLGGGDTLTIVQGEQVQIVPSSVNPAKPFMLMNRRGTALTYISVSATKKITGKSIEHFMETTNAEVHS